MKKEMNNIKFIVLIPTIFVLIGCTPKTAGDYCNRAEKKNKKNKTEEAIQDYTEAIRLEPHYFPAYEGRGFIYYDEGNIDLAITDLNKAIKNPWNVSYRVYSVLGDAYSSKGEWDLAISNYRMALKKIPDDPIAEEKLANAKKAKFEQRLAWYTEEIRKNPNNADLYFERGYMYAFDFEYNDKIALENEKSNAFEWLETLTILFGKPEDFERAISDWKMALKIKPNHVLAKRYLQRIQ